MVRPNPASPKAVAPDGFNAWSFVEPALFEHMAMTGRGTVVFHQWDASVLLANQEALDTRRLLLRDFGNNGQIKASARV